jgi:hypothetical protein
MANLNKTKLDASQCLVEAYDGVEEANRVIIAASTEFSIQLDAADGDSVISYSAKSSPSVSVHQVPGMAGGTVLVSISDVSLYSKNAVYCQSLTGVSVAGQVQLQASPDGSLWANLGSAISSPSSPGTSVSSVSEFVAKQLRIVSSVAPTGGDVVYTILLGS